MLDVPRVGKRRKNPTKSSVLLSDEISALVDTPTRIEARHEARCEEATYTSLHSKKKEARKIKPLQINNECIEKALIQLAGVVNTTRRVPTSYYIQAHLTQSHYHHISQPPCDT